MRVFVAAGELVAGELVLRHDEHHYLARVRRAHVGDPVEVIDGTGQRASAVIATIGKDSSSLQVGPVEHVPPPRPLVRVLVPLIKGDRMDDCIEKLVEVGADHIVVWQARRSVVHLEQRDRAQRAAHYQAVARAAARQSGGATIPAVVVCGSLAEAIGELGAADDGRDVNVGVGAAGVRLVLDPASKRAAPPRDAAEVTIASGPEGGLAADESEQLVAAGFQAMGLGPRVLRAATAPVIAVALVRAATDS
jgi:16S rRNA (uracil1498-N3)-methyltransferase